MSPLLRSRRSVWWSASALVLFAALLYLVFGRSPDPLVEVAEPEVAAAPPEGRVVAEIAEGRESVERSSRDAAPPKEGGSALAELRVTGDATVFPCALVLLGEGHAALAVLNIEQAGLVSLDAEQLAETKQLRAATHPGLVFAPELVRAEGPLSARVDLGEIRRVNSQVIGLPDRTKGLDLDENGQPKDFDAEDRALDEQELDERLEAFQGEIDELVEQGSIGAEQAEDIFEQMMDQLMELGYLPDPEAPPEEVGAQWDSGFLAADRPLTCGKLDLVVGGVWRDSSYVERTCGVLRDERPVNGFVGLLPSSIERVAGWAAAVTLASAPLQSGGEQEPEHPDTWDSASLRLASPVDSQLWLNVAEHPRFGWLESAFAVRIRPVVEDIPKSGQVVLPKFRVDHVLPGLWAVELFDERFGYGVEHFSIAEDGLRELMVSRGLESTRLEFPRRRPEDDQRERRVFTRMPGIDLPIPCGTELEEPDALILKDVPRGLCHLAIRTGQTAFQGLRMTCDRDVLTDFRLDPPRSLRQVPTGWVGLPTRARWLAILDEMNTPIELIELSELEAKTELPLLEEGVTQMELFDRNGHSIEWIRIEGEDAGPVAYVAGTWLQGEQASSVLGVL